MNPSRTMMAKRTNPKRQNISGAETRLTLDRRKTRSELSASPERLQKILAGAGLGSRRALERRIAQGQVLLNGVVAELGAQAQAGDQIQIDGRRLQVAAEQVLHHTLIYHKPEGELTTRNDPEGRRTVFDRLPAVRDGRWIAVGRLDLNTAGLLLLTTDGELANQMMHPSGGVDREYLCRIRGSVSDEQLQQLLDGIELEDGRANFSDLIIGEQTSGHTWYTVTLMEGRNREVRRLWEAVGAQVARLKRVRFGPVFLPAKLRTGQYHRLSNSDHRVLREDVGLPGYGTHLVVREKGNSVKTDTGRATAGKQAKRHRKKRSRN